MRRTKRAPIPAVTPPDLPAGRIAPVATGAIAHTDHTLRHDPAVRFRGPPVSRESVIPGIRIAAEKAKRKTSLWLCIRTL